MDLIVLEGELLKKIQETELGILKEVVQFCKENDIKYFLSSGTLLGAVREKGFIPWDDDVDISMPRKDFERFLSMADKLPEGLTCVAARFNDQYPIPIVKVRKNGTTMKEPSMQNLKINHGIWIDVFPIDRVKDKKKLGRRNKAIQIINTVTNYKLGISSPTKLSTRLICYASAFLGVKQLDALRTRIMMAEENTDGDHYTNFASNLGCKRLLFQEKELYPLTEVEFEGDLYCAPNDSDKWLTNAYGNYMELPPVEKRVNRHKVVEVKL